MKKVCIVSPDGVKYNLADVLTVGDVMRIFNVTRVTVYNWLNERAKNNSYPNGKFPHAFKFGKIYIPIIDIERVVQDKRTIV